MTDRELAEKIVVACADGDGEPCNLDTGADMIAAHVAEREYVRTYAEQRISFAYGNVSLENPNVTKEMVREQASQLEQPIYTVNTRIQHKGELQMKPIESSDEQALVKAAVERETAALRRELDATKHGARALAIMVNDAKAELAAVLNAPPAGEALFYVQDSRSYVGNDMLWWALNGAGYTTDLRKAQTYTLAQAQKMQSVRSTDIPWPKNYIDSKTRPAVDMQTVSLTEAAASHESSAEIVK